MTNKEKLDLLLSRVQTEADLEEYIYGVTSPAGRSLFQRVNDFLIDKSSISPREKGYVFELLATMLRAGISLNKALSVLTSKTTSPRMRRVIATLVYEVERGRPLSRAMDRFPDVFEESVRGAIRSAEAVGHLEEMLFKIAESVNRRHEITMRFVSALIYPAAVTVALICGIVIMLIFVVPRIETIFEQSSIVLPLPTRLLLAASVFVNRAWWFLLIMIILGAIAFHIYKNSEEGRFAWDLRKLRIPLIGDILRKIYVFRFVELLGLLVASGLPVTKSLEFVAGSVGNEIYRLKAYEAIARVNVGEKVSSMLVESPFLFPAAVSNMLAVGEYSASMAEMSQKIAGYFERDIDYTLKTLSTVVGPLLILLIGLFTAFFALAILSPIFSLTQAV